MKNKDEAKYDFKEVYRIEYAVFEKSEGIIFLDKSINKKLIPDG